MNYIYDIMVPKETVSDDVYVVTKLYYSSGEKINKGDLLASLETSKADFDIEAPHSGYVYFNCKEKDRIKIGNVIAAICQNTSLPAGYFDSMAETNKADLESPKVAKNNRMSRKARQLIEESQIDPSLFDHLTLVGTEDVEAYLNSQRSIESQSPGNSPSSSKIVILGGGNHTKVCIDLIRQSHQYQIVGIVYTKFAPAYPELMGVPILGGLDKLPDLIEQGIRSVAIGIGSLSNPAERWGFFVQLKSMGFYLPNLIHPKSIIEPSVVMNEGNQVMAGAVVGSCAQIANNCIINSNAVVSHDCMLADNVHITPGAILAGTVKVGMHSIIGMGSSIYYGTEIGQNTIVTNGKHIHKNIPGNQIIK